MTRKLVVSAYSSLDGVVEDPVGMEGSGLGNWVGPYDRGPRGEELMHEELFAAGIVLLGRRTYEGFAAVWPHVEDGTGFAAKLNSMPKYVASRTMSEAGWNNTTVLSEDVAGAVKALRADDGGDIKVYGSASLVHDLLRAGLVDVIHVTIYPTVLGRGIRLLPDGWSSPLQVESFIELGSGIISVHYLVSGD